MAFHLRKPFFFSIVIANTYTFFIFVYTSVQTCLYNHSSRPRKKTTDQWTFSGSALHVSTICSLKGIWEVWGRIKRFLACGASPKKKQVVGDTGSCRTWGLKIHDQKKRYICRKHQNTFYHLTWTIHIHPYSKVYNPSTTNLWRFHELGYNMVQPSSGIAPITPDTLRIHSPCLLSTPAKICPNRCNLIF